MSEPSREIASSCLALRARMIDRVLTRVYAGVLRPYGLTPPQLNVLVAIDRAPGVTAAALGRHLWLEKSTVSRNLRHLLSPGHIRIEAAGRKQHLYVTDAGTRLLGSLLPAWRKAQAEARSLLDTQGEYALLTIGDRLLGRP